MKGRGLRGRRLAPLLVVGLSACRLAGGPTPDPAPAPPPPATPAPAPPAAAPDTLPVEAVPEVRALWVVRTTLTSPEGIRTMVREAHAAGFNTLLVQVRGRADAFYRSSLEPRAAALAGAGPDFDPLATVLAEARPLGLQVHAWVNANLVWGVGSLPEDATHLVRARPDLLAIPRELAPELEPLDPLDPRWVARLHSWTAARQDRLEGLYTDPAHPAVRARLADVVEELVRGYKLDGIHLDYARYASPDFGRGGDQERRDAVTAMVRGVRVRLRVLGADVLLSAAVFPDPDQAAATRFQDWAAWLRDDLVDVVVPMAYTDDVERFRTLARAAVALDPGAGRRVWMGVGAYLAGLEPSVRQVAEARAAGSGGVALFSYDWATGEAPRVQGRSWLRALAAQVFPAPGRSPRSPRRRAPGGRATAGPHRR